ncbi:hypothetical protein SAMN05443550_111151 [Pedobacter hartonius]|uniref:Uncharacterized protein n=1 Tax=Pedobacter hartonius TaxID=425514 RepID=A0A1H4GV87_9SPHI|nr:hypothetical protein SAMN05443550_111151 [Pedobacter hartonius]
MNLERNTIFHYPDFAMKNHLFIYKKADFNSYHNIPLTLI